jgi:hypothetical protein
MLLIMKCCDPHAQFFRDRLLQGVFSTGLKGIGRPASATGPMLAYFKCRLPRTLRANVRLRNLLHGMKPRPVLLLRLFYGTNLSAKGSELAKFLLDCLQTFMPLAVSDLSIGLIPAFSPILLVQPLNLRNLQTETPDLFP